MVKLFFELMTNLQRYVTLKNHSMNLFSHMSFKNPVLIKIAHIFCHMSIANIWLCDIWYNNVVIFWSSKSLTELIVTFFMTHLSVNNVVWSYLIYLSTTTSFSWENTLGIFDKKSRWDSKLLIWQYILFIKRSLVIFWLIMKYDLRFGL